MNVSAKSWCVFAIVNVISMTTAVTNVRAQTAKLAWDEPAGSVILGYAVTIDGVRKDYGLNPVNTILGLLGTSCGCSITLPFSGGYHTIVVSAYSVAGESASSPLAVGPSANAGGPYSGSAGTALAVTGAGSDAPTGSITSYAWHWGDGSNDTVSTSATASHVFNSSGTYTVALTITDNAGAKASSTAVATIGSTGSTGSTGTQVQTLPSPWLSADVGSAGNVGVNGSCSYASSTFTISGAGEDFWGTVDAFQYAYRSLAGDGEIVSRVTGIQNTDTNAKAGIMIRESLNPNSAHVILEVRPGGGIEFMSRPSAGASTSDLGGTNYFSALPIWLKLVRSGSTISGYASRDGASWTGMGTTTLSATNPTAGLAVTSNDTTVLNVSTFDHVTVTTSSTSSTSTAVPTSDVVIYASDISPNSVHGMWTLSASSSAANGVKLTTPDAGVRFLDPLPAPDDYVDVAFSAAANTQYTIWLRLRSLNDSKSNDSLWVQFSDAEVNGQPVYRINTDSALMVVLSTDVSGSSSYRWGWANTAYWLTQATTVTFDKSGTHTLRLQVREDGVQVDQIVLSPSTYIASPPGSALDDNTIVPKS
jgi:PKD repeat protein